MKNIGIEVVDSSAYNPSSNGLVERSVRTLKQLLKKCGPINQLQLREMIFCSNSREQEGGQGSPLSRFLGHGVRTGLPNSLDRNLNWNHMMSIRAEQHQRRVEKPGKTNKDQYSVGETCWVQDVRTKKWDKEGVITQVRTAYDGRIVSYDLTINGSHAIRHRRYLRKKVEAGDTEAGLADTEIQTGPERTREFLTPRRSSRNRQAAGQTTA
jgi:hypothetical protein